MCKHPLHRVPLHPLNRMRSEPQSKEASPTTNKRSSSTAMTTSKAVPSGRRQAQRISRTDQQTNRTVLTSSPVNSNNKHKHKHSGNLDGLKGRGGSQSPKAKRWLANSNENLSTGSPRGDKSATRSSPSKSPSTPKTTPLKVASQPIAYAGAKFSDPPSPKVLPKPPMHWMNIENRDPQVACSEMTSVLKVMLKVQA